MYNYLTIVVCVLTDRYTIRTDFKGEGGRRKAGEVGGWQTMPGLLWVSCLFWMQSVLAREGCDSLRMQCGPFQVS